MRVASGRDPSPSEVAVDSQSVETATMVAVDVGCDSGKKIHRRQRHLTVDLLGLVLRQYCSVKAKKLISDVKFRNFYALSGTSVFWLFRTKL